MADKYICMKCHATGTKKIIPYRIIDNRDDKVIFKGQLCEDCFNALMAPAPTTDENNDKEIKEAEETEEKE